MPRLTQARPSSRGGRRRRHHWAGAVTTAGAAGAAGMAKPAGTAAAVAGGTAAAPPVSREALASLRKELNGLVGAWSHRTGQPHGVIHAELRKSCGGPPLAQATADQIRARIQKIRDWAITGRGPGR